MADVGGIACDIINGSSTPLNESSELWRLPGVDGFGAHLLGKGQSRFRFTVIKYDDLADLQTWLAALVALVGTTVDIVDNWPVTHDDCFITAISDPRRRAAHPVGGRWAVDLVGVRL